MTDFSTLPLGELVDIKGGGTPSRENSSYWNGSIPWATVKDLNSSVLSETLESITPQAVSESATNIIPSGSIITATRMALGRVAVNTVDIAINQDLKALFCKPTIDTRYLFHFLNAKASYIESFGKGATVKGITLDVLRNLSVPLPPLPEQRRIAAILDKAHAIRRKRQEALALTDEFLRSAFVEMFGDPVKNPKGWDIKSFQHCIRSIQAGWSASSEPRRPESDEWGVLKISAVTTGRFLDSECKAVAKVENDRRLLIPKRGDFLFSRANTRELVAATCLVEKDCSKRFLPDKLWKIVPNESLCTREYLRYLLSDDDFRALLTRQATGTSGSMLNISKQKFFEQDLPLPPVDLQKNFGRLVWLSYDCRNEQDKMFQEANSLFNSLTQRAFRGEL